MHTSKHLRYDLTLSHGMAYVPLGNKKTHIHFAYTLPSLVMIPASRWLTKGPKRGWAGAPGSTVRTPSLCAYSPPTVRSFLWLEFFLSLDSPHYAFLAARGAPYSVIPFLSVLPFPLGWPPLPGWHGP